MPFPVLIDTPKCRFIRIMFTWPLSTSRITGKPLFVLGFLLIPPLSIRSTSVLASVYPNRIFTIRVFVAHTSYPHPIIWYYFIRGLSTTSHMGQYTWRHFILCQHYLESYPFFSPLSSASAFEGVANSCHYFTTNYIIFYYNFICIMIDPDTTIFSIL